MSAIDPRMQWMSNSILLSEWMGCDTVYRFGVHNRIRQEDSAKLSEGHRLAEELTEVTEYCAVSFTYGYISPHLSRAVVRYQDPNKPSYHRWDKGAACDMILHPEMASPDYTEDPTSDMDHTEAPIITLSDWQRRCGLSWSRAITYAESPVFCFATQECERKNPRFVTYENRYVGTKKPEFKKLPLGDVQRLGLGDRPGWEGRGWPSYHGGGRRQYEHVRTGRANVLSDFLYDAICTHKGIPNKPPLGKKANENFLYNIMAASLWYEGLVSATEVRFPIIGAYVNPQSRHTKIDRSFDKRFVVDIALPPGTIAADIRDEIEETSWGLVYHVVVNQENDNTWITVIGANKDELEAENYHYCGVLEARMNQEKETFKRGINYVHSAS